MAATKYDLESLLADILSVMTTNLSTKLTEINS
jgi:hypothetical protein